MTCSSHLNYLADMETVSDVIDLFGGTSKTAKLFGVLPSAVSNWKADNRFPPRIHFRVFKECEQRGLVLPDTFFAEATA